jgi:hypothetical protein
MSLFADDRYRWRETYFVLFNSAYRPTAHALVEALQEVGSGYQVLDVGRGKKSPFESLTVISPSDFAAMDISFVSGEEVAEQVAELRQQLQEGPLTKTERSQLDKLVNCDARFDIYHFEQISDGAGGGGDDDDEFLDPGSLLLVLKRLAKLCHGIVVDPQSGTLM